jgi:2-polyprenyl-6-hydroxyphenyl methylase/3-demethylubiquinone-9 3-methyltransferase
MQFNFGQNWKEFSAHALSKEKIDAARKDFSDLLDVDINGKTFLDIGFGQGMSLLLATERNAKTFGCDINPICKEVLEHNKTNYFNHLTNTEIPVVVGSILDKPVVEEIKKMTPDGKFDIVHSWGVLHHTGNMTLAIENVVSLVKENGTLVLALYNRHWTSPIWLFIKWFYCKSPKFLQRLMIWFFYPIIWLAKFIVTGKSPKQQQRGMDFYYDIIDWVGGYPYEYETVEETKSRMNKLDFECVKAIPARVPTGCNEFVFKRIL